VEEKVGVIGKKNGKYQIVEYSEFPAMKLGERLTDGSLKFNYGYILVFVVRSDFLLKLALSNSEKTNFPYFKAHKKISHCDPETWETVVPEVENGWKFELHFSSFLPMVD
jgi:UDP-N-acetylglucosamine/UDP-N-acetylgalactosamine diphosphorylase